jgi:hypothetical protein
VADAWGGSWGSSWGVSWGDGSSPAPAAESGGDDAPRRYRNNRFIVYFDQEDIPDTVKPVRKKVTRKIVAAALKSLPANPWTISKAQEALPAAVWVPQLDDGPQVSAADLTAALAVWLEREARRLADEQDEEEVITLLLLN